MRPATTRSSRWCSVGSGTRISLFPKASVVLGWAMREQASKVLSQTSLLPLPLQIDGQALFNVFVVQRANTEEGIVNRFV